MRFARVRGSGAYAPPPRNIFKVMKFNWCVLVCILNRFCLKNLSKIIIFYIKLNYSSYTLVMGYL